MISFFLAVLATGMDYICANFGVDISSCFSF